MKKLVALILVVVFVFAFSSAALAFGGANGQAWKDTSTTTMEHYTHNVVGELRFDQTTGRKAIPGNAFANANPNSVIHNHGGQSLVDPMKTW